MSDPRSTLRDVANKILSVVNQMEQNTIKQPPSQTSSLMQKQPSRQISSPMQISQTPRPVSPIETKISRTSRSTPSFRIHNGFNSFSTRTEKIPLPPEIRVKAEGNLHRCVKLLLWFLSWPKSHEKYTRHRKKARTVTCRTRGKEDSVSI